MDLYNSLFAIRFAETNANFFFKSHNLKNKNIFQVKLLINFFRTYVYKSLYCFCKNEFLLKNTR